LLLAEPMNPNSRSTDTAPSVVQNHFPQLDGLRALAAFSVIAEHFSNLSDWLHFPVGLFGLWLFFVLSGFLITGILLRSKADADGDWKELSHAWRAFYARRMLRIFPLYYTVLLGAAWLDLDGVRRSFFWNAIHLANVAEISRGLQAPGFAHFWSLSVEEQFYFIWPTIVLLAPRKYIFGVASAMVFFAPISRLVMMTVSENFHYARVIPPSCTDGLGMGALLGLLREGGGTTAASRKWVGRVALGVGLLILAAVLVGGLIGVGWRVPFSARYSAYALIAFWLIDRAADGFRGPVKFVLESPPLLYLGKISFGIYVIHLMIPSLIRWLHDRTGHSFGFPTEPGTAQFLYVAAASVGLATISWYALERPINDLKRYFPYADPEARAQSRRSKVGIENPGLAPPATHS